MNHPAVLAAVTARAGLRILDKRRSPLMWTLYVLSFMWLWNRRFMSGYWTTIGRRCYAPGPVVPTDWRTIAHEGKHVDQHEREGLAYSLRYLAPQVFAVPALLALLAIPFSSWWLCSLVFLVALGPWPSSGRARYEAEAYTMSAVADVLVYGRAYVASEGYLNYMAGHFGRAYYYPVWGAAKREALAARIVGAALAATSAAPQGTDPYILDVMAVVKRAA